MEILYSLREIFLALRILNYRKKIYFSFSKLHKLLIITAADKSHEKSLIQLLSSIDQFEPNALVKVYDLGLSRRALVYIENNFLRLDFQIIKVNFADHPDWMNVGNETKGEYAWKPLVISDSVNNILEGKNKSNTTILWLDAGDKLYKNLRTIRRYIQCYGFWSPASDGVIKDWTHQGLLDKIKLNRNQLNSNNLNGAVIGFSLASKKALNLLEKWTTLSQEKDFIAPEGSSRANHRQDQALLTVLAYKCSMQPKELKVLTYPDKSGILIHSDIDYLFYI